MRKTSLSLILLAACGGGSSSKPTTPEPEPVAEAPAPDPASGTGAPECDALVVRVRCMYEKTPDMPEAANRAFDESVSAWTAALADDATRQATIDACVMSLDAGHEGLATLGCWAIGDAFDDRPVPDDNGDDEEWDEGEEEAYEEAFPEACDTLIKRTRCMFEKNGKSTPREAIEAFDDAVKVWAEALENEATRQATLDACQMSLEGASEGFEELGC